MQKNRPEIRFEGFNDDWEQRKFDEAFDCTIPNNTLSRAELSYDEGTVLNVHYGDVLIKYGSVLDVQKEIIPRIPHKCREAFNGALLQDGDIIVADTAEDETAGKVCEIGNVQGSAIASGLHTMVCRPRDRMASGYLGYYLNSNAYHHQLLPLMQGTKVLSLSRSNIQKTSVAYPAAIKEQQLISSSFSHLDHLIDLQQRKCDRLQALKSAMLEKMFPKAGSDVPEIRFAGFTEAWKQRKLNEILCQRIEHQTIASDAPLLAFSYADGVINPEDKKSNKRDFIMTDKFSKIFSRTELNDIIYNPANVIHGAIHRNKLGTGVVSPIYKIFVCNGVSPKYMGERLHTDKFIQEVTKYIEGTVIKLRTLSPEMFLEMTIEVPPSYEEQEKIGDCLAHLDHLITLHQRKLQKLQECKKALLEKMFVS